MTGAFHLSLRMVLVGLGIVFILALALDSLRRKRQRLNTLINDYNDPELGEDALFDEITQAGEEIEYAILKPESTASKAPTMAPVGSLATALCNKKQPSVNVIETPTTNASEIDSDSNNSISSTSNSTPAAKMIESPKLLIIYAIADPNRPYSGYELLQALLSAGLRFGNMNIFHRFQELSGKGAVLFSCAQVTEPGTFDIQKMGTVSVKGLCFFMHLTKDANTNAKRLALMQQTAQQLVEDLGGKLLNDNREPYSSERYVEML